MTSLEGSPMHNVKWLEGGLGGRWSGELSPHSWSVTLHSQNQENTNQIADRSHDSVGSKAALAN